MEKYRYDHIIIGAGIAGLYRAYQLLKQKKLVLVIEKSNRIGGRIQSFSTDKKKVVIEAGPSLVHSHQHELFGLIRFLGLKKQLQKSGTGLGSLSSLLIKFAKQVLKHHKLNSKKRLLKVEEAARMLLSEKEFLLLQDKQGDWFENKHRLAVNYASEIVTKLKHSTVFSLKEGIQEIVDKLFSFLLTKNDNIVFLFDTAVESVAQMKESYQIQTNHSKILITQNVHVCTSVSAAREIKLVDPNFLKLTQAVKPIPTIRIYGLFKKPIQHWFPEQAVVSFKGLFRWAFSLSTNLVELSYTDAERAQHIYDSGKTDAERVSRVLDSLSETLHVPPLSLDDLSRFWLFFWPEAFSIVSVPWPQLKTLLQNLPPGLYQTFVPKQGGLEEGWMNAHLYSDVLNV